MSHGKLTRHLPLIDRPLENCMSSSCSAGAAVNANNSVWILPSMTFSALSVLLSSCTPPHRIH